ncbi:MAG TPA: MobF family relaxase [Acetobacteraceae bacterium]|nr:MobF family relaxase [Acetobacteraceae bacterium]
MNNVTKLTMRGGSTSATIEYLRATEYYNDAKGHRQDLMEWGGSWAQHLGLAGTQVAREAMDRLAEGYHPTQTGANGAKVPLCRNAGAKPKNVTRFDRKTGAPRTVEEGGHVIGYDVTFSAPKDLGLAFMAANEEERAAILDVQKIANREAMAYYENLVETRRGKAGKDVSSVEALIWSSHLHLAARPSAEGMIAASLHTHNLVYGVALGRDGKSGTFDSMELFEHRRASDAIYKNALYAGMRALGYHLEQTEETDINGHSTGRKDTRLAGFPGAMIEYFSARQGEILEYMEEHGVSKQVAWSQTRQAKQEPGYDELSALWTGYMDTYIAEHADEQRPTTAFLKAQTDTLIAPAATQSVIDRLHESEALLERHDIFAALAEETMGRVSPEDLQAATDAAIATMVAVAPHAIHADDAGKTLARRHTEHRYAAPWMLSQEKEVQEYARRRMSEDTRLSPDYVTKVIADYEKRKGFALSDEQRGAVMHVCCTINGIGALSGYAGSGKTTVSECFVDAYRGMGYEVFGCAPSNAAAKKLQLEAGIPCFSVAHVVHEMEQGRWEGVMCPTGRKSLIVMDEAGMVDTADTRKLLALTDRMVKKPLLLLQGDLRQIQPVGAGSGMALIEDVTGDVKLTEIRRQKGATDEETSARRELAGLYYEQKLDADGNVVGLDDNRDVKSRAQQRAKGERITAALDALGMLEEYTTKPEAMAAAVRAWAENPAARTDKLLITHKNVDVDAMNTAARAALKASGALGAQDHNIKVLLGRRGMAVRPFAVGEAIKFSKKSQKLGVVNNSTGTITGISIARDGTIDLTVRVNGLGPKDPDRTITFNTTNDYRAFTHSYCRSIHDVQGQGAPFVYHVADAGMLDNQSALVAMTRLTSGDYRMYGDSNLMDSLQDRLGIDRLKETALLATGGVVRPATSGPQRPSATTQSPEAAASTHPQGPSPSAALEHGAQRRDGSTSHNGAGGRPQDDPAHRTPPVHEGTLVAHGRAPYQFNESGNASYYVTIRNAHGQEQTLWGKDLDRAINGHSNGDMVRVQRSGKDENVTIKEPIRSDDGNVIDFEERRAQRRGWTVQAIPSEQTPSDIVYVANPLNDVSNEPPASTNDEPMSAMARMLNGDDAPVRSRRPAPASSQRPDGAGPDQAPAGADERRTPDTAAPSNAVASDASQPSAGEEQRNRRARDRAARAAEAHRTDRASTHDDTPPTQQRGRDQGQRR